VITLYGIKNCDTVKKARSWLELHSIEYAFHDFREQGIDPEQVRQWLAELGWEQVVNKRSTTWKQLPEDTRAAMDETSAAAAILEHPTLVKRPLLDTGAQRYTGFKDAMYREIFHQHTL
jgi:Spx/MgsR family transcriptional regulator